MPDEWMIRLTRDEALVLADYLSRWQQTSDATFADESERTARDSLLAALESADDGTAFAADYADQVVEARRRLHPQT